MATIDYTVDFGLQSNLLTPPYKRLPKILAFLFACLTPWQWLYNTWLTYIGGESLGVWSSGGSYSIGNRVISDDNFTVWEYFATAYDHTIPYQEGTIVYYTDGYSYSSTSYGNKGNTPALGSSSWIQIGTANPNPLYSGNVGQWFKVMDDWVGAQERAVYSSKTLQLEYILNKRFNPRYLTVFRLWSFIAYTGANAWKRAVNASDSDTLSSDIYITPLTNKHFIIYDTAIGGTIYAYGNPIVIPIYDTASYPINYAGFTINVKQSLIHNTSANANMIAAVANQYITAGTSFIIAFY